MRLDASDCLRFMTRGISRKTHGKEQFISAAISVFTYIAIISKFNYEV